MSSRIHLDDRFVYMAVHLYASENLSTSVRTARAVVQDEV